MREIIDGLGFTPKTCTWELTLRCNLNCGHCGSRAGRARPSELPLDRMLGIADELVELGCQRLTLSGGEPTLHEHWAEVGERAASGGIRVNMITNALHADRELVRQAKNAGLVNLGVSLDGTERIHDEIRGRTGLFKRVDRLIEDCCAERLPLGVITTITKTNFRHLDEIADVLRGRVFAWQLQIGAAMGNLLDGRKLQIDPVDLLEIVPTLARLVTSSGMRIRVADNVGYYGPHEETLRKHRKSKLPCWVGCMAGCRHLGIEADGGVKGCLSLQATSATEGNLQAASLREIWTRPGSFAFNRSFQVDQLSGFCRTCQYASVCRGGCFSMRTCEGGVDNPFCYHRVATLAEQKAAKSVRRYVPLMIAPAALAALVGCGCSSTSDVAIYSAPASDAGGQDAGSDAIYADSSNADVPIYSDSSHIDAENDVALYGDSSHIDAENDVALYGDSSSMDTALYGAPEASDDHFAPADAYGIDVPAPTDAYGIPADADVDQQTWYGMAPPE